MKHYSTLSRIFSGFFIFLCVTILCPDVLAKVYVYSMNDKEGLIAYEAETMTGNRHVFGRALYPERFENITFVSDFFVCNPVKFNRQRSVFPVKSGGRIVLDSCRGKRWNILPCNGYLSIKQFSNGLIQDRYRVRQLPFYTTGDFFDLFTRIGFPSVHEFYLLKNGVPRRMTLIRQDPYLYNLKNGNKKVAEIRLRRDGILEKITLVPDVSGGFSKPYTIRLRAVRDNVSKVGIRRIIIYPEAFKSLFQHESREKNVYKRYFSSAGKQVFYDSMRKDTYTIDTFVRQEMKTAYINANVISSQKGFSNLDIDYNQSSRRVEADIKDRCSLTYKNRAPAILALKKRYNELKFTQPVKWRIENSNQLKAVVRFEYMKSREGIKSVSVRRRFSRKVKSYSASYAGDTVTITGYRKAFFLFPTEAGKIHIRKSTHWSSIESNLESRRQRLVKKRRVRFDKRSATVDFEYEYLDPVNGRETITFPLDNDFKNRYGITPGQYKLRQGGRDVTIKGFLSSSQKRYLDILEIKNHVNAKFTRAGNCISENWSVVRQKGKYKAVIDCHLRREVSKEMVNQIAEKRFDVMDHLKFSFEDDNQLSFSFWGFKKSLR